MSSRDRILRRVRDALGEARGGPVVVPRDYHDRLEPGGLSGMAGSHTPLSPAESRAEVVGLFTDRVAARRATVRHVGTDGLGTTIAAALWGRRAKRIMVPADLPFGWLAELDGVQALAEGPSMDPRTLDVVDAVVTGCAVAIARTGTIVLDGGRAQGRRALTLMTEHHLCVVHADQIVGTVPEAISRLDPRRPLTWITGTSETLGVELERVEGVHGPGTLEVLIVED